MTQRNKIPIEIPVIAAVIVFLLCSSSAAVVVRTTAELVRAIHAANAGGDKLIQLADGTYTLNNQLWIAAKGVTVRSVSGNRAAAIIQGRGMRGAVTHIFNVAGSRFSVHDLTLQRVSQHAVQLQVDVDGLLLQNLHIRDTGEQMVKVAYDPNRADLSSDNGVMKNCLLEYSAGIGPQYYIGGIDAHNAKNWVVQNNTFRGIRSPSHAIAEHAVHFWSGSKNTLVEKNRIINCDRGIGFGLGERGHQGGIIRNNMIYHNTQEGFADVGIALESAPKAKVYNNTFLMRHTYPNAIEYRFSKTSGIFIANNLTNRAITSRDGASGRVTHNCTTAASSWFSDPESGDLHLRTPKPAVVDKGIAIAGLTDDFDGDSRPHGKGVDIGADEFIKARKATVSPGPAMLLLDK